MQFQPGCTCVQTRQMLKTYDPDMSTFCKGVTVQNMTQDYLVFIGFTVNHQVCQASLNINMCHRFLLLRHSITT